MICTEYIRMCVQGETCRGRSAVTHPITIAMHIYIYTYIYSGISMELRGMCGITHAVNPHIISWRGLIKYRHSSIGPRHIIHSFSGCRLWRSASARRETLRIVVLDEKRREEVQTLVSLIYTLAEVCHVPPICSTHSHFWHTSIPVPLFGTSTWRSCKDENELSSAIRRPPPHSPPPSQLHDTTNERGEYALIKAG